MDSSPFPYQGPLHPEQVSIRVELIDDLIERVSERRVTALLGPRRFGKTTVLGRVAADLEAAGTSIIWLDLYEVTSFADLAVRIDHGLSKVRGQAGGLLRRLAAGASLNLGVLRLDFSGRPATRPDPIDVLHRQLDVVTELAQREPLLVVLDEFSSIDRVDGAAGLLRTHLQHHYQHLGLLFAGSEPSMMRALFTDQAQPFFAQADVIEIEPFTNLEVVDLVQDGFAETGRQAGRLPQDIWAFAQGHPQRSMQLADAAWLRVQAGKSADDQTWPDTLDAVRGQVASGLERLYSSIQPTERTLLRIVAGGGSIFGPMADHLELTKGGAQHARGRLIDVGQLSRVDNKLRIVDPLFADWIRQRVPA